MVPEESGASGSRRGTFLRTDCAAPREDHDAFVVVQGRAAARIVPSIDRARRVRAAIELIVRSDDGRPLGARYEYRLARVAERTTRKISIRRRSSDDAGR